MTETSTPTQQSSEEEDELRRSIKKFKDSNGARSFTQPRTIVSYRDTLMGEIPSAYEQAFSFERNWDDIDESHTNLEPLIEGMVEVKLSKETFSHIRAPWAKALIVKVYGRTVGFNYLTFKINALWKPLAKLDCVNLGKDFFLIRFSSSDDYDKVLKGGPWFVGEHFLAIKRWEPYFKASEAKLPSVAMWALCFSCGCLGHKRDSCPYFIKPAVREEVVVNENISTEQKENNQLDSNYGP
nr:hypothetical protein CFP56_38220 [Quercus suber]